MTIRQTDDAGSTSADDERSAQRAANSIEVQAADGVELPGALGHGHRSQTMRSKAIACFEALVEVSADAIVVTSADGIILFASPASAFVFGDSSEDLAGRALHDYVHPDDTRAVENMQRSLLSDPGRTESLQFRLKSRAGPFRWIESKSRNRLDDDRIGGIVSHLRDVTDRLVALQAQARLAAIVEFSDDAIITMDLQGNVTSWNRSAERLFGYDAAEVLGQSVRVLMPDDRPHEAKSNLQRLIHGHSVPSYDTMRRRKNGSIVEISLAVSPIRDTDGKVVGAAAIARDRTEARRAEEAIRRTKEQLQHAQKMEAVGRLAGGVAHDFNNVLSAVLSYSTLAIDELGKDHPCRPDLEAIRRAGERAAALTRQLLAFSRQQILLPRVINLNDNLAAIHKMLSPLLGEDIELSLSASPSIASVSADPGQIEQIIVNLAVNARDAMPQGGKLSMATSEVEVDEAWAAKAGIVAGPYVRLTVSDTGVGMDGATQAKIFEPFFTTKEPGKGTGLGLSTVLGIVNQSGGHIDVHSKIGIGTTFEIYLPRTDRTPDPVTNAPPPLVHVRGSETILLVDDDELVRDLASAILCRRGYEVLTAKNGAEAFLIAEKYRARIGLVLTDVVMPGMSGRKLAERLAASGHRTKVLFMSGYTDDAVVHHGMHLSGVDFLQKPIRPHDLLQKVREVLDAPDRPSSRPVLPAS